MYITNRNTAPPDLGAENGLGTNPYPLRSSSCLLSSLSTGYNRAYASGILFRQTKWNVNRNPGLEYSQGIPASPDLPERPPGRSHVQSPAPPPDSTPPRSAPPLVPSWTKSPDTRSTNPPSPPTAQPAGASSSEYPPLGCTSFSSPALSWCASSFSWA